MKQILDDLWQSEAFSPFPGLTTQCYLLRLKEENALFFNTGHRDEFDEIATLGGIQTQFLSHRHESGDNLKDIKARFQSRLICDSEEATHIARECHVDETFSAPRNFQNGVVGIPTPGHTSGGSCFYYESPTGERYLFTGDLIYVKNEKLATFVYPPDGGSPAALKKSLKDLANLHPTYILSSAFGGDSSALKITPELWSSEIERNIKNLS